MKIKKIKDLLADNRDNCLSICGAVLLLSIIGYIIYVNFSYYWDLLHFDIATDLAFVKEAAEQGTLFPKEWLHLREIRLMHITTIVFIVYLITGNLHLSYPIAVSLMLPVNCCLFYYMLSYKKTRALPVIIGLLSLLMVFSCFVEFANTGEFTIFSILFFTNGSYALHLSTVLLTTGAYLRLKTRGDGYRLNRVLYVFIALMAFAQGMQSTRLLIGLYMPILMVEGYFLLKKYLDNKEGIAEPDKASIFAAVCFMCTLAGIVLVHTLFRRDILITQYTGTNVDLTTVQNQDVIARFQYYVVEFMSALGLRGGNEVFSLAGIVYFGRLAFLAVLAVILRNIAKKIGTDTLAIRILTISVISLSLIMVLTDLEIAARHFFTIIILLSVVVASIMNFFICNKKKMLTIISSLVVFAICIAAMATMGMERRESLIQDRQNVVNFIREQNFKIGYGTVWQGEVLSAIADYDFKIITISDNLQTLYARGMTQSEFNHTENNVFLVTASWLVDDAVRNEHIKAIIESGERHDFSGGWVVYVFDYNPWA